VVSELDLGQVRRTRTRLPLLRDERHALVRHEIERSQAAAAARATRAEGGAD
jgi:hypothetical protein